MPHTGLGTGDALLAEKYRTEGREVVELQIPTISLDAILEQCASPDIHWLKIDVEGAEQMVLQSWSNSSHRPWIVVVEATSPLSETQTHAAWHGLLISKCYHFVYFDGLNRF